GVALALLARGRRGAAAGLGMVVGLAGVTALFQYLTGVALGIDTVLTFGRTWGRGGTLTPGRMGPPAAVSWTLAGTALVLLRGGPRWRTAVSAFGVAITGI